MKLQTDNEWTPMMFPSFPAITEDVWHGKVPMCRRDFDKETGCQWTCIYDEWKSYIGHSNIKPDGFVLDGVVVPDHKHHIYLIANELKIINLGVEGPYFPEWYNNFEKNYERKQLKDKRVRVIDDDVIEELLNIPAGECKHWELFAARCRELFEQYELEKRRWLYGVESV